MLLLHPAQRRVQGGQASTENGPDSLQGVLQACTRTPWGSIQLPREIQACHSDLQHPTYSHSLAAHSRAPSDPPGQTAGSLGHFALHNKSVWVKLQQTRQEQGQNTRAEEPTHRWHDCTPCLTTDKKRMALPRYGNLPG
jgi:hypothetical protein